MCLSEKLAALIPPPRSHLVRWSGVFAPNSPFRKEITLKPEMKKGFAFVAEGDDGGSGKKRGRKNYTWSKMLARVFKIDVLKCGFTEATQLAKFFRCGAGETAGAFRRRYCDGS